MAKLRKKHGSWFVIVRRTGGREKWIKVGHVSKAKALQAKTQVEAELVNKKFSITEDSKLFFDEFSERYLRWSQETKAKNTYIIDKKATVIWKEFFGRRLLQEIDAFSIERFKSYRKKKGNCAKTINIHLSVLRHMLNMAIKWRLLTKTPFKDVSLLKVDKLPPRFLSHEEIQRLFQAATPWLMPFLMIGLNTGMRKGEILNLQWAHVDLDSRRITVAGDTESGYRTKTGSYRTVFINNALYDYLQFLTSHWPDPFHRRYLARRSAQMKYVICSQDGSHLKDIKKAFNAARDRAGIKGITPHTLRHTFASHLVMAGVNLQAVQRYLGHSNYQVTLQYSHLDHAFLENSSKMIAFKPSYKKSPV